MIPLFFLVTMLCFDETCIPMPILGPATEEDCGVALVALTENTPLPPDFVVVGRCVNFGEPA